MPKAQNEELAAVMQPKPAGPEAISPAIIIAPIVISIVMSGLLGLVYGITKEPIAESKRLEEQNKLKEVMPAFDNDPLAGKQELSDSVTVYTGENGGVFSGYGVKSSVETGYSGHFSIMFGVNTDGSVNKVQVLESAETPGLGSKAGLPPFIDQFNGKMPGEFTFKVVKDGGDVDAITGATITSRAVSDCLANGLEAIKDLPEPGTAGSTEVPAETAPAAPPAPEPAGEATGEPVLDENGEPITEPAPGGEGEAVAGGEEPVAGGETPVEEAPAGEENTEPAADGAGEPGTDPTPAQDEPAGGE